MCWSRQLTPCGSRLSSRHALAICAVHCLCPCAGRIRRLVLGRQACLDVQRAVLLTGTTGVGKSVVAAAALEGLRARKDALPFGISFSAQTAAADTQVPHPCTLRACHASSCSARRLARHSCPGLHGGQAGEEAADAFRGAGWTQDRLFYRRRQHARSGVPRAAPAPGDASSLIARHILWPMKGRHVDGDAASPSRRSASGRSPPLSSCATSRTIRHRRPLC